MVEWHIITKLEQMLVTILHFEGGCNVLSLASNPKVMGCRQAKVEKTPRANNKGETWLRENPAILPVQDDLNQSSWYSSKTCPEYNYLDWP